jgi:hypothetical protein
VRSSWRDILALAGSLTMLAYGIHRLPGGRALLQLPRTPIDNSRIHESAAEYRLLLEAARVVPANATVLMRSVTGDAERDTFLHRFAVAFLPGRKVLPAAVDGRPVPAPLETSADYLVILGRGARVADGVLLLETEDGTVWRRNR